MRTPLLVCPCGMKVRVPGAAPGRVGRCPSCGGRLEVPPQADGWNQAALAGEREDDDSSQQAGFGYDLQPAEVQPRRKKKEAVARDRPADLNEAMVGRRAGAAALDRSPITDGLLRPLSAPESSLFAALLYPLRSADPLGVVAAIGAAAWILIVLVAEYCLTIMADAESLGAGPMGILVNLITVTPAIFLLPFAVIYLLQYLGRVIVTSGKGETVPPKTPDRNFDGFFDGLSYWFIWLLFGAVPALAPLALTASAGAGDGPTAYLRVGVLLTAGVAYASIVLMRTFLDDSPLAGNPAGVIGTILGHGLTILPAICRVLVLFFGVCGLFGMLLALRGLAFWVYIPAALPFCIAVVWALVVAARVLGLGYYHHRDTLKWQAPARRRRRERARMPEGDAPLAGADV
ncbi:hypothetical protein [Aquisphaera insulae]|uniref:hypothetical protein n=1 Tax=Aquisphaera insulae TaxID=2712864 RepID=UPI0013EDE78A|nr:hypothetical protein [Aquisphaera insulae]